MKQKPIVRVVTMPTPRLVTMMECPDCGMPIQASREHECDPWKWLNHKYAGLRSRCEELEATIDRLIADINRKTELAAALRCTCARLRNERDAQKSLAGRLNSRGDKAEAEREQFRQFGITMSDRLASYAGVDNAIAIADRERDEARQWARRLLAGMIAMRKDAIQKQRCINQRFVENADLRAQLAEARNKALDEAISRMTKLFAEITMRGTREWTLRVIVEWLTALKS